MKYSYRSTTTAIFIGLGSLHEINSTRQESNHISMTLFRVHLGQLSVIALWLAGNTYHVAWNSNYSIWKTNPSSLQPMAHTIWDPHYSNIALDVTSSGSSEQASTISYSGIYNLYMTIGIGSNTALYNSSIALLLISIICLSLVVIHARVSDGYMGSGSLAITQGSRVSSRYITPLLSRWWSLSYVLAGYRLSYHISVLIGLTSILWAGHLIHVALPSSRGALSGATTNTLDEFMTGRWITYAIGLDQSSHIHGSSIGAGESILTFIGGIRATSNSLPLTDMSHHHLALGVICIWAGHMYSSISKGIGNRMRDLVSGFGGGSNAQTNNLLITGGYELELSIALSAVGVITSLVAQHMYSIPAYVYLASDYTTVVALYVHHQWISSILMLGSLTHGAIYLVREYTAIGTDNVIMRVKKHKGAIISHLSWVSQWLGFHTLFIYSHNDTVNAFAASDKSILIEPVYAQIIQSSSGKSIYGISALGTNDVNAGIGSLLLPIGPSDMISHHAIALGLHVTILIVVKGALDGRGSRMLPDKLSIGFGYPCDGPGRGGTCDISCWDSIYLASFWVLNTVAWALFYFHWKHLTIWQNISVAFQENGGYLLGWFRDYLWFNSAPIIGGYSATSVNDTSVWTWLFLAAHLAWATGFMFLISWRGYWQELIESIIYMHVRTPIVSEIWSGGVYAPVALSIVQARMVGLVHFAVGFILTYSAFVIATTK